MKLVILFLIAFFLAITCVSSKNPRAIIVGAGISGISAAKKLADNYVPDFLILEASNRIGGRIQSVDFGGHKIELGANWIFGVRGPARNPLFDIGLEMGLQTFYSDFTNVSSNTYKQEGGLYPKHEAAAALYAAQNTEAVGKNASVEVSQNFGGDDMSILALQRLLKREPRTPLEKTMDVFTFDRHKSVEPALQSLVHTLPRLEMQFYGEHEYFVADPRGVEGIVEVISRAVLSYDDYGSVNDSRIKFNQVVTEIEYSNCGVTVRTEDGNEYEASSVIVSPSIGVLQSNLIKFIPELPIWKQRAIAEFSLGFQTKIFLKFPKKFWPTGPGTEFFFYVHERRGYFALWQHLENQYPGSNILKATITGEESVRIEEQSEEETKAEAMGVLKKMFGKEIPEPSDMIVTKWRSDRFYRGGVAYWPIGYTSDRMEKLQANIGALYFTGEHTDDELFGYATGAYWSGGNTARDVIDCLRKARCKNNHNRGCTRHDYKFIEEVVY